MDLSDLLEPERIRCRCDCQSKKRTLQTVAELLGESLRAKAQAANALEAIANGDDSNTDEAKAAASTKSRKTRKTGDKSGAEHETPSDMVILDALISRERLGSTGLGHGVGLPHSRLSSIKEPIAALVTLDQGVDYESADGQAVDLVFGLLVPEDCNDEHLKILAQLARRFSDEMLRSELRAFAEPVSLYDHLDSLTPVTD